MTPPLQELETYLLNQIAEAEQAMRLYQESIERCRELRTGLQRSLDALREAHK